MCSEVDDLILAQFGARRECAVCLEVNGLEFQVVRGVARDLVSLEAAETQSSQVGEANFRSGSHGVCSGSFFLSVRTFCNQNARIVSGENRIGEHGQSLRRWFAI